MNQALWQAHLENLELRRRVQRLHVRLEREKRKADYWRCRAMPGRPPGRATRKAP